MDHVQTRVSDRRGDQRKGQRNDQRNGQRNDQRNCQRNDLIRIVGM